MEGMLKSGSFKDKTVIITGGGTGLGRSMGKYLLELGANLVITSRKKDVLDKTAAELESQTGGKVLAVPCDVRKYDEIENVIRETRLAEIIFCEPPCRNVSANYNVTSEDKVRACN